MGADRFAAVRAGLRWLAPALSVGVLVVLIARASSCSQPAAGPAAVVPDTDTRAAPVQAPVAKEPALSAAAAAADAGTPARGPTIEALTAPDQLEFLGGSKAAPTGLVDRPRRNAFLGGSKSGIIGVGDSLGDGPVQAGPPSAPPANPAREVGE